MHCSPATSCAALTHRKLGQHTRKSQHMHTSCLSAHVSGLMVYVHLTIDRALPGLHRKSRSKKLLPRMARVSSRALERSEYRKVHNTHIGLWQSLAVHTPLTDGSAAFLLSDIARASRWTQTSLPPQPSPWQLSKATISCSLLDSDLKCLASPSDRSSPLACADISELNLSKGMSIKFPQGKDKLLVFEITMKPDEGIYR